jgi:DNA invertase Pin-like site-specific DNA recombinase
MLVGYARVSTHDQTLALQRDALQQAGCSRIFTDTASGARADRPGLEDALGFARPGDTLVVWKLDRLGRSLPHLLETVARLQERGVGFRSLTEQLDTTSSGGKLVFHVFAALAEFERDVIRERTQAGLAAPSGHREAPMDDLGQFALDGLAHGPHRLEVRLVSELVEIPDLRL